MIDVRLNADVPESERQGVPEWPFEVREARGEQPPRGWVRMSMEDYRAHRAKHEAAQDAWIAANPPPVADPVPTAVSLSDFLWAATMAGVLRPDEALAAARTGDIPASLEAAVLAGATEAEQFEIRLMWAAMYEAERSSPFWGIVKSKTGGAINDEVLDGVFRLAGQRREMIAAQR